MPAVTVNVSPSSVSVPSGGTEQFTATVTNTTNTGVTWSTSAGSITTTGLLSLAGVSEGTNLTVTATSVADTTKYASASVNVTQRVITISFVALDPNGLLSPDFIPSGAVGGVSAYPIQVATSGAEASDILTITDFSGSGTVAINATNITLGYVGTGVVFCSPGITCTSPTGLVTAYDPHFVKIQVASADGTIQSNVLWKPLITDQPTLAIGSNATTAYFAPGFPFPVQEYLLSSGAGNGTTLEDDDYAIAVDNQTGDVLTEVSGAEIQNSASNSTLSSSNTLLAIAALNSHGYVTEPNAGIIGQINNLSQMAISSTVAAGSFPWAIDAATVNGEDFVAVYSEQDTTIRIFDSTLTPISSLALTGVTEGNTILAQGNGAGGWPLRFFQSGTVALLSSFDKLLFTATLDSTQTLHLVKQATLTGNPIGIAKDETHQKVVVWYADTTTGMTTMQSFDLATLTGTNIASASTLPLGFLASDVVVSSDSSRNWRIMPSRSLASEARFLSASTASSALRVFHRQLRNLAGGLGDLARRRGLLGGRGGDQVNLLLHLLEDSMIASRLCGLGRLLHAGFHAARLSCITCRVSRVSSWMLRMVPAISSVALLVRSASRRTSPATTANPRPCSPARAASMAAFRASRLVCSLIS
jgi:hypothetical protein